MVRKEITDLRLKIGDCDLSVKPPFSVFTQLKANKSLHNADDASLFAILRMDSEGLKWKHHALLVKGCVGDFTLYLNEEEIGVFCGGEEALFDLTGRLSHGDNLLELRFLATGEELLSSGISGKIEHICFENAIIRDITVDRRIEDSTVNLDIAVTTLGEADHVRAVATLVSSSGQIYYGGLTRGKGHIVIRDPLYWWPRGLGVQNLYKLTVNLYGEHEIEDTREIKIGVRRISTPVNPDSSALEVGGVPFIPMGAVVNSVFDPDPVAREKKIRALVSDAAMAGFNTLVLPLGVTMPEVFYDLCDVNGIVVIKEFAGSEDEDYRQLMRLSPHPSLGFLDVICSGEAVASIADRLHTDRPDLEFSNHDRAPKYPSAISLPTQKTCYGMLPAGERNLFSATAMNLMGSAALEMLGAISESYPYPGRLSDAAYLSALVAAERVIGEMRRARLTVGAGRAVFDSLNEDGALASASSVDSMVRRKALHYKAMKAFSSLAVFAERDGYQVAFSVSNERRLAFVGQLEWKVIDRCNRVIYKEIADCQVAKNSSRKLFTKDLTEYFLGHEEEYYLEYYVREGLGIASVGTLLFTEPKSFKLADPKIDGKIVGHDKRYSITLTPSAYARDVEIDFADADAVFYENYIDLTANAPYKISFTLISGEDSAESLMRSLRIRSLYDVKNDG